MFAKHAPEADKIEVCTACNARSFVALCSSLDRLVFVPLQVASWHKVDISIGEVNGSKVRFSDIHGKDIGPAMNGGFGDFG